MRIRASTCRPRGWSRLRSPRKVQHLWAFGGICGGGMPAEAASAPHFQTPAPCFLLHPLHLFLPTYTLSSAAGSLTLVWHTGQGSVTRPRVMECGRCCSPPSAHSARRRLCTVPGGGRESGGAEHACAPCQPLLIAEISIWECLDPRGGPRLSQQGGKGWRGCHGNWGLEAGSGWAERASGRKAHLS